RRAPTRFSRKTLNWRTLGQSRPRDVANPVPAPSPELIESPSARAFSIAHGFYWGQLQQSEQKGTFIFSHLFHILLNSSGLPAALLNEGPKAAITCGASTLARTGRHTQGT